MNLVHRTFSALFLSLVLLTLAAHCCCWAPAAMDACMAPGEMTDCCCNRNVEVTDAAPDFSPTLLSDGPRLPDPEVCAGYGHPGSILSEPFHVRQAEGSRVYGSRSSPALYLLNTSFLI